MLMDYLFNSEIGGRLDLRNVLLNRSGERVRRRFARFLFSAGKSHTVPGRFPGSEVTAVSAMDRFTFPSKITEWNYETEYLVTVAGPRWDFTSFPIKPLGRLRTP
jgi:hypothetical protein